MQSQTYLINIMISPCTKKGFFKILILKVVIGKNKFYFIYKLLLLVFNKKKNNKTYFYGKLYTSYNYLNSKMYGLFSLDGSSAHRVLALEKEIMKIGPVELQI